MGIQAVSFGNNMQTATPAQTKVKKPMDPIAKGATIGGGIGTGFTALGILATKGLAKASGMTYGELVKNSVGSWGKYIFSIARGVAIYAAVGAAIGGIVKLVKGKEEDDEPETPAAPANNQVQEGQKVDANV